MAGNLGAIFLDSLSASDDKFDAFLIAHDSSRQFFKLSSVLTTKKITKIRNADIKLKAILKYFNIPESQWGRYLGAKITPLNLIDSLLDICTQEQAPRLYQMKAWLDQQNKLIYWKAGLFGAFVASTAVFPPFISIGLTNITYFFASLGLVHLIGIFLAAFAFASTLFPRAFSLFSEIDDENDTFFTRFKQNFFSLMRFFFNGLAYGFLFAAATSNPVIGALFVFAAAAEVFQQIYNWIRHPAHERVMNEAAPLDKLYAQEEQARKGIDHKKRRNEILINLVEAVLYTAIVLFSCFFPGGFIITLASIAMIGAVMLIKNRVNAANDTWAKNKLSKAFTKYEIEYEQTTKKSHAMDAQPVSAVQLDVKKEACCSSGHRFFKHPSPETDDNPSPVKHATALNKR